MKGDGCQFKDKTKTYYNLDEWLLVSQSCVPKLNMQ